MSRHQRRIAAARALRDRLASEGRTTDARIVDELARSSATSAALNRSLHTGLAEANERTRLALLRAEAAERAQKGLQQ